ncbi:hypothetical protein [Paenibacillus caui]|uniref:hypothetical protein n=1 Tax=Paenibacillus caui TaxID=2873927 RepID=UPI001CA8A137|nr:hypothetical protein [Paenibacillus caui]
MLEKYVGEVVEIIYMDRAGRITQRRIEVHAIRGNLVRAACLKIGEPRAFRIDHILAVQPPAFRGSIHAS